MKAYVKPELFYESFELSQHIAACGWDMSNFKSADECSAVGDESFNNPSISIFTVSGVCDLIEDPEAYCYTNGSQAINIFNS